MNKKILIASQSHLCKNPRVLKEATVLDSSGYNVIILTAIYSTQFLKEDLALISNTNIRYVFFSDLTKNKLRSYADRFIRKIAIFLQMKFRIESKFSLGYGVHRLKPLCKLYDADLYIMHQEVPTIVGSELIRLKYKVAFDFEDWYSKDLLPEARIKRPLRLMQCAEKFALDNGIACWTTSWAMASEFKNTFKLTYTPDVVYNSFNSLNTSIEINLGDSLKLYWLSQTIGSGRGLEFFIEAIAKSKYSWSLVLRGNITNEFYDVLISKLNTKDSLTILPQIPFDEISSDLCNYDYGIASELKTPLNKNLTIANKLFYYLSVGLPIIVSDTLGHLEILSKNPSLGYIYNQSNMSSLIDILNGIAFKKRELNDLSLKKKNLFIYSNNYCWQLEKNKLLKIVEKILA